MIDNRENNVWTVYVHIIPKSITKYDYDKYYVGITSKSVDFRWKKDGYGYVSQNFFYKAIKKYGWNNIEHYIIAEHLTENEAMDLEKFLIAKLKSNGCKYKYGYNLTDGGEGSNGYIPTEEARKKMCLRNSGKGNPYYGKKHTEEIRLKMKQNHANFKGENHPIAKNFHQFDIDGNYIKTYGSVKDAAIALGVTDGIGKCARNHKRAVGYLWGYDKDITIINGIPKLNYTYEDAIPINWQKVYMFDENKNFIKSYLSCGEAERDNNINRIYIARAARKKGKITIHNIYLWRYEKDIQFDENNNPIFIK